MYRVHIIAITLVTIVLMGCVSGRPADSTQSQQVKLTTLSVTPAHSSVPIGRSQQYSATGTYSDGSTRDLTSVTSWRSTSTNVGAITATGRLSPLAPGTTSVIATASGITGSTTVTVIPAAIVSLSVVRSSASIAYGTKEQFTAIATFTDGTTQNVSGSVTWSVSQPAVATVNATGTVTALAPGTTVITATSGTVSASASLTVTNATVLSLGITPANASIPLGVVRPLVVTGTFSDSSSQDLTLSATWSSSNPAVATLQPGSVAAVGLGSTTITASFESVSNSTSLTVVPATLVSIALQPANPQVALGTSVQLAAIGTYDNGSTQNVTSNGTWSSSTTSIATVTGGLVKSQSAGLATISASIGSVTGSTTLNVTTATLTAIYVTPATPTIAIGATRSFSATGSFSDGTTENLTTQVTWNSSNTAVAGISGSVATGVAQGSTTISASFVTPSTSTVSGSTTLTVSNATLTSVTISPASATILVGKSQQFYLTGHYSDGTAKTLNSDATWTSSNTSVAAVSSSGGATGIQAGTTSITAAYGSFQASGTLTVSGGTLQSISVSPVSAMIAAGTTQQFSAKGLYSDGSTQNLTALVSWTSSDFSIATVSGASGSQGLAAGVAPGSTVIGALVGSLLGSATLTVSNATLTTINIVPQNPIVSVGASQNFSAMGTFTDGTTQNITRSVTWNSTNPAVATINAAGTASTVSAGTTTITARAGGVSGTTTLTVQ